MCLRLNKTTKLHKGQRGTIDQESVETINIIIWKIGWKQRQRQKIKRMLLMQERKEGDWG